MNALLEVRDLHIRFPVGSRLSAALTGAPSTVEAVAGVSFSIRPGETYALVGESGSGKTSLARGLVGLVPLHSGTIAFDGRRISRLSERNLLPVRREVGMIFQDPTGSLSPRLSVRSILAEPFRVHRRRGLDLDAEVARLLDDVGLPASFASRYPHQLSGGQARRVGRVERVERHGAVVRAAAPGGAVPARGVPRITTPRASSTSSKRAAAARAGSTCGGPPGTCAPRW
jgi:peptide/nickel transport system ATP-binding protein